MIEVVPVIHSKLQGRESFDFCTKMRKTAKVERCGTRTDHIVQDQLVSNIINRFVDLSHFACTFAVELEVDANRCANGQIRVYNLAAEREALAAVRGVQTTMTTFWSLYSRASFRLQLYQAMIITKVH